MLVLAPFGRDTQRKTVIKSKPLKLHRIHRPHGPVIRRGAMAQRHHDAPARLQQRDQFAHRARTLFGPDMLPNAAQPDQIKAEAQLVNANQAWQAIIHPANARIRVQTSSFFAESLCRFCRNHLPAMIGKPGCIAPAARADVQNKPWR